MEIDRKKIWGEYLTPTNIFKNFILPEIKDAIYKYIWVDLFCGEGNLVLPILELVPYEDRIEFFKKHIFLFDIQKDMVERTIAKATKYGVPEDIARRNVQQRDSIKDYPVFILKMNLPVCHITNPPYMYLGYIASHKETQKYLEYFQGFNKGYQDLYQLAMINDLRHNIEKMIYIIPTSFLFGSSVSNKIRNDFLLYYTIKKAYIFEKKIFEATGINVLIAFFERKPYPIREKLCFEGIKISDNTTQKKVYILKPENHFRAGNLFEDFVKEYRVAKPLKVSFYLTIEEVNRNNGNNKIEVINVNKLKGKKYTKENIYVNDILYRKIKNNILFLRTVDTGGFEGRAGLYLVKEVYGVDGILVVKATQRTQPIQLFFNPQITEEEQILLKKYFNLILEYLRKETDSEFMTTYKYSNSKYIRKYLGLTQAKMIIETFPILVLNSEDKKIFRKLVENNDVDAIKSFLKNKIL